MNLNTGTQSIIAGALFDFAAWLTTQPSLKVGASEPAGVMVVMLQRWARERHFNLDEIEANVSSWDKTASVVTLDDLMNEGYDMPQRIAGALRHFVAFVEESAMTDYPKALLRWATKTGLEVSNPQKRWLAHWWA